MANSSARGGVVERLAIQALEAEGYTVHRCTKTVVRTRFGFRTVGQDVFGCIDIIAKRPGADELTRWIQVTSTSITRKVTDLAIVPWNAHDSVEIWRWVGGKGKRTDGRTGKPRQRMYFQVYRRNQNFIPDEADRVTPPKAPRRPAGGPPPAVQDEPGAPSRLEGHQHQQ